MITFCKVNQKFRIIDTKNDINKNLTFQKDFSRRMKVIFHL